MARVLLIIAIAAVGWYLYRRLVVRPDSAPPPAPPAATGNDTITRCAHCGVHVPDKSGVHYQSLFFCSPDHLNDYLRKQGNS